MNDFDTFRFVLHCIYVTFITFGNVLTLAVLYITRQWETPSGLFIGNLAIIDVLVGSFLLPFGFPTLLAGEWDSGNSLCLLNGFTNQLLCVAAVVTLTVISIDRYIAIIHSIRYHQVMTMKRSFLILAVLWSFAVISAIVPFIGWGRYVFAPGASLCVTDFKTNRSFTFFVFTVVFGIPMNAVFFIYIQIFRAVRKQLKAIRNNTVHPENCHGETKDKQGLRKLKKETKAALTMFIIIGVFTVCMTPYTIFNLYCLHTGTQSEIGDFITSKTAYMNAFFNPLIYGVMNKVFRKGYLKLLNTIFRCRKLTTRTNEWTSRNSVTNAPA